MLSAVNCLLKAVAFAPASCASARRSVTNAQPHQARGAAQCSTHQLHRFGSAFGIHEQLQRVLLSFQAQRVGQDLPRRLHVSCTLARGRSAGSAPSAHPSHSAPAQCAGTQWLCPAPSTRGARESARPDRHMQRRRAQDLDGILHGHWDFQIEHLKAVQLCVQLIAIARHRRGDEQACNNAGHAVPNMRTESNTDSSAVCARDAISGRCSHSSRTAQRAVTLAAGGRRQHKQAANSPLKSDSTSRTTARTYLRKNAS